MEHHNPTPPDPEHEGEPTFRERIRRELIEELPESPEEPGELALKLRVAIQAAILTAHEHGQPIDDEDAGVIAEVLSFALDDADTALRNYGRRTGANYDLVRQELIELAARPTLRPEIREAINWLATHLLYEEVPGLQPDPREDNDRWTSVIGYKPELGLTAALQMQDEPGVSERLDEMTRFILDHGVPALAYLRLPDVDASAPDLEARFRRRYLGSHRDLGSFVDTVTQVYPVGEDNTVGERIPYRDLSPPARAQLLDGFGRYFCAVDVGGQIHAFRRQP